MVPYRRRLDDRRGRECEDEAVKAEDEAQQGRSQTSGQQLLHGLPEQQSRKRHALVR
jgi:hypothetical protein